MGRRAADERPPIEILGADPTVDRTQSVRLGPRGPRRTRGRALAVAAIAAGVLLGGLVLGGTDDGPERPADDELRDNSDHIELGRRPGGEAPTTATTLVAPLGPLFGEPIQGALLVHRSANTWVRLDLTTGALEPITLPDVDLFNAEVMPGGIVIAAGEEVRYYEVLGEDLEPGGTLLGTGNEALRAGPERLWLFDQPGRGGEVRTTARLVDLRGTVLREVEVPGYQTYATSDEVLATRGGRVYVVEDEGYRPIATGWINGVVGDEVLVTTCDDDAECALQLQPTDGGAARSLARVDDPDATYYTALSTAADDRAAIVAQIAPGAEQRLLLLDAQGDLLVEIPVPVPLQGSSPQWLPGDRGLLITTSTGLQWVRPTGDGWTVEPIEAPGLGFPQTIFVVTP